MSKRIIELAGIKHYVGTGLEVKLMANKINELVNQVNELTEAVNALKGDNMKEQMSGGGEDES